MVSSYKAPLDSLNEHAAECRASYTSRDRIEPSFAWIAAAAEELTR
jgi:hypothetical protein